MAATGPDFQPGQMLPGTRYRVVRQIGAGGMGIVYQVVKPPEIMGVLKLMSTDLTEHEEFRTRFLDEVRVLAQLDHPNIVRVFDYDALPDGTPFYVMELLHGRTVRDVLATMGTLPPRVAFEVIRQLCEALHCAHTHDIPVIHRDIKPENIFLHAPRHGEPVVKLIDFGVVAVADRQHDGAFVGTWKYAAPEQIRGERATPATDLYAVGLVLYEMLCGVGPFEHLESGADLTQAHLRLLPPPVSKFAPWVPPSVVELIASALAKEPRQRPRDAYAFAERLYELEWAKDGKDPSDRTAEGPLSRILSTVGGGKPSSKNMVAAAPKDRIGNMPVIGIPADARHGGPTLKGVGDQASEHTAPGEDTLLAGLGANPDRLPRSKKVRPSEPAVVGGASGAVGAFGHGNVLIRASERGPKGISGSARVEVPTLDAPPSDPKMTSADVATAAGFSDGTTRKLPPGAPLEAAPAAPAAAARRSDTGRADSDTLGAQESDARRAPTRRTGKLALPIALGLCAVIGAVSFAAYRVRPPGSGGAAAHGGDARTVIVGATDAGANGNANANEVPTANANEAATAGIPNTTGSGIPTTAVASASPLGSTNGKPLRRPAKSGANGTPGNTAPNAIPSAAPKVTATPTAQDPSFVRKLE